MNRIAKDIDNITCGFLIFNSEKDMVLLIRRPSDVIFPNTYSIPGGRIKQNESIESAALRELYEETHTKVNQYVYLKSYFYDSVCLFVFTAICDDLKEKMIPIEDLDGINLAPNIGTAIKDAQDYYNNYYIDTNLNINNVIEDIIYNVANNRIVINDKIGYDHFLCQQRIGTLGSAVGLNILSKSSNYYELKKEILHTLLETQLPDGGWGIKSHDNRESILESTCYALQAINLFEEAKEAKTTAIKWIYENRLEDYSWGANITASKGKVTSTCLAITTLCMVGEKGNINESIQWLIDAQNTDGGWAFDKSIKKSNVTATSLAIIALYYMLDDKNDIIKRAISWLSEKLNGSDIREESEVSYIDEKRFEYKHSTIIYALSAIICCSGTKAIKPPKLLHYISEILTKRNENGFWEHESTPGFFPIWHTYNILKFLLILVDRCGVINFSFFKLLYEHYRFQIDFIDSLKRNLIYSTSHPEQTIIY